MKYTVKNQTWTQFKKKIIYKFFFITCLEYIQTCKKYSVTVIFYCIFHLKPQFFKTLFQSQFLFLPTEALASRVRLWTVAGSGKAKDYKNGIYCA
jgi:hypothetical protein